MRPAAFLDRLSGGLNRAAEVLLAACAMLMALTIALQVLFRYGFNESLFWSEELGRMLLVQLTFLGASVAYRRGAHIGVDFLTANLPPGPARILRLVSLAACMFFFTVLLVHGLEFLLFIQGQSMTTLPLSRQVPLAVVPVSGGLMLVHALADAADELAGGQK
jgi:TRAP-type C4-dicarboxylate transport system permease small subunit